MNNEKNKFLIVLSILILSILVGSCSGHQNGRGEALSQRDTVYVHIEKVDSVIMRDTITMPPETIVTYRVSNYIHPGPIKLDSIETQEIMEASLVKGRIELPLINDRYPDELFYRKDLEYMPYMMLTLSKPYSLRDNGANTCLNKMVNICYHSIYDDRLQELGKRYIDSHNELIDLEPPIMNPRGKVVDRHWRYHEQFETRKITSVDSLRIKALIHNDRDALTKLEEHYREIGYELGVAIYYKVMLGFEGNGDLPSVSTG